jgi:predicted dehydrogenase
MNGDKAPETVRCGVIGLGRMGQNHLRVLSQLKGAEISFVYDQDEKVGRRVADIYGVRAVDTLESNLESSDALIIASPTITHADYVLAFAGDVRSFLVEKPLAESLDRTEQIAKLARDQNLHIQVGFVERYNPAVQQLRGVLERSGDVLTIDFTRTNKISARITDVDVVADLMIHDIDLALYLNGPVVEISAHGVTKGAMVDLASAVLTHANGRFSRIFASRVTDRKLRRIEATCRDLFVECDLLRKEIVISRQSEIVQPEGAPYAITAIEEFLEVPPREALQLQLQCFLDNCRREGSHDAPAVGAGEAAMRVCSAVRDAILKGNDA